MVHAENSGMIAWMSDRLVARGHTAPRYHALSHPALAEAEAINRAISLARLADAPLLIVHVSTPEGAGLVADARLAGARIYGETCPQYLFLDRSDLDRPGMEGAKFMCSPPVRDAAAQAALWRHVQAGTFDVVSSDHAPYRFDETGKLAKGPDATFKQIANGMPGIAARLPLMFSEGVVKGPHHAAAIRGAGVDQRGAALRDDAEGLDRGRPGRRHRDLGSRHDAHRSGRGPARRHGLYAVRGPGGHRLARHRA